MTPLTEKLTTRIRYKVLAATLVIVAVMGAIGWIGFYYIRAVSGSVAVTTQLTSPLLASALRASEATRRLVGLAHGADRICITEQGSDKGSSVPTWYAEFGVIGQLHAAAIRAGLSTQAKDLPEATNQFLTTMASIAELCRAKRSSSAAVDVGQREAVVSVDALLASVNEAVLALDGQMSLNEEHAKVALQLGQAAEADVQGVLSKTLFEIWPVLRSLYKLREHGGRLEDGIASRFDDDTPQKKQESDALRKNSLSTIKALAQRVAPRLTALGYEQQANAIGAHLQKIDASIKGTGGFEASERRLEQVTSQAEKMQASLTEVEQKLASEMSGLEEAARKLDADAQATMTKTINEASLIISFIAGLAALGTLLGALSYTDHLMTPIEALTRHAKQLQDTQDVGQRLPPDLLTRSDEIGRLATSFNGMIAALAEARQRLLAESRAEIKVQFDRLKTAIEGVPHGIYLIGADDRVLLSNARFAQLYGLNPQQITVGTQHDAITAAIGANGARTSSEIVETASGSGWVDMRQTIRTLADGRTMVVTRAPTSDGGAVIVHEDITERRRTEAKIAHMAHHDALTGLPNRVLFRDETAESLIRRKPQHTLALLYIDLDHFKAVNDTLGHPVGDSLLILVSKRLCACLREDDHVARLGGDEFAIVLNSNPPPDETTALAERIIESVAKPYEINGQQVIVGVSIGVAMAPIDGTDADRLMQSADMALYRAKREGGNVHCFFEPEMDARMHERRCLELALRKAVASNALQVYYQPLVGVKSNQVEEFEALLRWNDPERGSIPPSVFIPLAEETGLINEIGSWVLKRACQDAVTWPEEISVAVNISPLQFRTRTLVLNVVSALESSGLKPNRLELEITEGVLLNDTESTLATLKQLQQLGVRIAMDDFGTGYSSLSYLRKFNFNKVKIDRSFVGELDKTADSLAIVRAVSGLCASLGIDITAEGVETPEQLKTLREEGCTQIQGYLIGRPCPASDVPAYFEAEARAARKA
jgi:diguanylate cyclase (GGDEF)-like protein